MTGRIPRWLKWFIWLGLALVVIYLSLNVILTSTAFSRFVLNRVEVAVPELQFTRVGGNFTRGLRFDLRYDSPTLQIAAREARLRLRLECLWQMTVCIRRLHAEELRISLLSDEDEPPATPPDPDQPGELPEISLPVEIHLESLTLGSLLIESDQESLYQLHNVESALVWRDSTLAVDHLLGADQWCRWAAEAEITFIHRYPLTANMACESMADFGEATAQISGDLFRLQTQVIGRVKTEFTEQPAALRADFTIALFQDQLPVDLRLQARSPIRVMAGEDVIQLNSLQLDVSGPLLNPQIDGSVGFENPYWSGPNQLSILAHADLEALQVQSLTLQLPEGQLSASGQLDYGEGLHWQGRLAWQDLGLEQFAEAFPGQLAGELVSEVEMRDGELRAQMDLISVTGTVLDRRFAASGQFRWEDEALTVQGLDVRQGENRVRAAGSLSLEQALSLQFHLDLPQLRQMIPEQWAPEAGGAIAGELQLSGSLERPALRGDLVITDAHYNEIRLRRGDLKVNWQGADQDVVDLDLRLIELALAEDLLGQVTLRGRGTVAEHTLDLSLAGLQQHDDKQAQLRCTGGFQGGNTDHWGGLCDTLNLAFNLQETQQWHLQAPIQLDLRPGEPQVTLAPFCLTYGESSLCSQSAIQFQDGQLAPLAVEGSNLPATWFHAFLSGEDLQLEGRWGFRFAGRDLLTEEPELRATATSSNLRFRWQTEGQAPLAVQVTSLDLNWAWLQQAHQLSWVLETEASGSSRGEVNLEQEQIRGQLSINGLQLAHYSRLFLPGPDDELVGEINAQLGLRGSLEEPVLNGQLNLSGGMFSSEMLPLPLQDIQLTLAIDDNRARAQGRFRAAESDGRIGGEFTFADDSWSGLLTVAAEPLMVQPEPDMRIYVAPDLQFAFRPGRIGITGQVRVPRAEIELSELPEQAVSVSSDAVIVGDQDVEAQTPMEIVTNIEVVLGDRVMFEGFGLETRITGSLRLQQRAGEVLRANGRLSLVEGRYSAYAQNLVIRSGDLVFVGDIDNPQLRVEAVRGDTPEDLTVGLRASGPARSPQVTLFSRPDMPQQAQLSYLLTGNPPGTAVDMDPQLAAAEAALSYALESSIGSGITRRAGDVLGIEDLQVTAGATEAGTQIGLSGYVTPNLLVRYGVGVFDTINTWTLRYQVSRSVYLEAISGENSDIGIMWSFERD